MLREKGREGKKRGKNNFLARPPNPSPGISDIPSLQNVLIKRGNIFIPQSHFSCPNKPTCERAESAEERVFRGGEAESPPDSGEGTEWGYGGGEHGERAEQ